MQTKIQKWGNSLGLRIPKLFAEQAGIRVGSEVDLAVEDDQLIIRPRRRPKYVLSDLLDGVTEDNLHGEVGIGRPVGKEVW